MKKWTGFPLIVIGLIFMLVLAACGSPAAEAPAAEAPAAEAPAAEAPAAEAPAAAAESEAAPTEAPMEESAPEGAAEEVAETPTAEPAAEAAAEADAAGEALTGTRTFAVVPGESTASYVVNEEFLSLALDKLGIEAGKTIVVGSTDNVTGQLTIDLDNKTVGENQFVVDMTSLSTDQNRRDNWIRENGPRFNQFPEATFVATGVENAPEQYVEGQEATFQLLGDLTVRGVTVPVTFDVTASISGDTLTGMAEADLLISSFGIEPPNFIDTLTVADPFVVRMELMARAQ